MEALVSKQAGSCVLAGGPLDSQRKTEAHCRMRRARLPDIITHQIPTLSFVPARRGDEVGDRVEQRDGARLRRKLFEIHRSLEGLRMHARK
jgi:hypothetical protein